jgi:hypothetical protein
VDERLSGEYDSKEKLTDKNKSSLLDAVEFITFLNTCHF